MQLAQLITQLFPTEEERTYFYVNRNTYGGKLFSSYRTYKRKCGDIELHHRELKDLFNNNREIEENSKISPLQSIQLVVSCQLSTAHDLRNLIIHEMKMILLNFKQDNALENVYREELSGLIAVTLLKQNHEEV